MELREKLNQGNLLTLFVLLILLLINFLLLASNYSMMPNFPSRLAIESSLPWWDRTTLTDCEDPSLKLASEVWKKNDTPFYNYTVPNHCGVRAGTFGNNQKVLSYVLFGNTEGYAVGLPYNLADSLELYPGWVVRLHTDPRER